MNSRAMHYDFKQKLNKIDSQQYRNLRVPEIDWKLNEAVELFIKMIAQPRTPKFVGFEKTQRSIDDIRTIVKNNVEITPSNISGNEFLASLPSDYMFYVSADITISKEGCGDKKARAILIQHDDEHEDSPFDDSSYEWGEVNIRFFENGIKIFSDGTFTPTKLILNYIKKPSYIHNAQDYAPGSGSYNLPDGTVLTGSQDCELPEHTHREIVDIAVLITSGDLDMPNYQLKQQKINLST
jgi:hypothetical protein